MYLKKLGLGLYELGMLALVVVASLLRIMLIRANWPVTNSDEATIDLMAQHIAYRGEHPIFYYGQFYMGALEAYLGAPFIMVFGTRVLSVRLGLVLLFALFLICMYFLTSLLYSRKLALFTIGLLSFGSIDVILHQLKAIGGYPETLFFGACITLLTAVLTLTSHSTAGQGRTRWRAFIYTLLGLLIGLAVWTDQLILPLVATSGLLLVLFCYKDLLRLSGLLLVIGFIIGAAPLIMYNLHAAPDANSLTILLKLQHSGAPQMAAEHIPAVRQLVGSLLYALPAITSANPLCPVEYLPLFGPHTANRLSCTLFQGGWATGYLILWLTSALLACMTIWNYARKGFKSALDYTERRELILHSNRLMLLLGAGLTLISYTLSPQSALVPGPTSRYLICLLIATPAILWPLWQGLSMLTTQTGKRGLPWFIASTAVLVFIAMMFVMGTIRTFQDVPTAQTTYGQQDALIHDLLRVNATRIYSDYWTCNRIIFQSDEHIICSVLKEQLQAGQDRYKPYHDSVKADIKAAYAFSIGSPQAKTFEEKLASQKIGHWQRYVFDGYVVYLPASDAIQPGGI
jgi:hypothetical protein